MFEAMEGEIVKREPTRIVLGCGGLFYEIFVPTSASEAVREGQTARLLLHDVVQNDRMTLFGFATEAERTLFRLLIGISGIGPQTALLVLSRCGCERVVDAVRSGKPEVLRAVRGIGKRTAERIVVELRERVEKVGLEAGEVVAMRDAVEALVCLGYNRREAEAAVARALKRLGQDVALEEVVKEALKSR